MVNIEQINIDKYIEVINTETTQLKENSKRYVSNKKALLVAEKYEKIFEKIGKKYDIDIAVDKKTGLYYIIFGENALDIGLDINELDNFLNILLTGFQGKPIMGNRKLEKYDRSKIGNFIREVSGEKFSDPLYNTPNNGIIVKKSKTEINIEKEARKLVLKEETYDGIRYKALNYGKNIIFGIEQVLERNAEFGPFAIGNSVKFKETKLLEVAKDVIEGRRSIESITKDEIMIRISNQSNMEVPIAEQKEEELKRFKDFLTACINLKKYKSYPISFGLLE